MNTSKNFHRNLRKSLLILIILIIGIGLGFGYNAVFYEEEAERTPEEMEEVVVYESDFDLDSEVSETLKVLAEENDTLYYIRNELLFRNEHLDIEDATLKAGIIYQYTVREEIDPWFLIAIGIQESELSHRNPETGELVVSSAGAKGIFQIMPVIERIYDVDAESFSENVEGSAKFLSDLMDNYENYRSDYSQEELVLAHYNGGSSPEYAMQNYQETSDYVPEVLELYQRLRARYE